MAGSYANPGWTNNSAPALEKINLDDMSNAIVRNQTDIDALQKLTAGYAEMAQTVATLNTSVGQLKGGTVVKKNVAVASGAWEADGTYTAVGYGYRAVVPVAGATAEHAPIVCFSLTDALSGNFAPVCLAGSGTVTIWAKAAPKLAVTIPSIICLKQTA